jgi:cytidine deaminase
MSTLTNFEALDGADFQLVEAATQLVQLDRPYPDRHRIGTAMLTESGETFLGVCVQAEYVKPTGVCAERIALGQWATAACTSPVIAIASVRKPRITEEDQTIKVAASCGICREILTDYWPDARMITSDSNGNLIKFRMIDTLPLKYTSVARES